MLRTFLRSAALIASIAVPLTSAAAQDDTKLVDAVSPQVAEVHTGGSWTEGKQGGFYRVIVVMAGDEKAFGAHVFLQWLAFSDDSPLPTIVKTVPIKEVNAQNLGNASVSIEGEEGKDNEVTIVVGSYDVDADKDISLFVKAGLPGTYAMTKAPPKSAIAPGGDEAPPADAAPAKKEAPGKED